MLARFYATPELIDAQSFVYLTGSKVTVKREIRDDAGQVQFHDDGSLVTVDEEVDERKGGYSLVEQGDGRNLYEIDSSPEKIEALKTTQGFEFVSD